MAMNKQRRTANLNNIVTYDTLKNVTLLADLTIEGLTGAGFVKADANGLLSVDTGAYLPIPSQSGNAGKYLTTDGANLSWGTVSTANIYNSDGTLTGNRTVNSGGFSLTLNPNISFGGGLINPVERFESTAFDGTGSSSVGKSLLFNDTGIAFTGSANEYHAGLSRYSKLRIERTTGTGQSTAFGETLEMVLRGLEASSKLNSRGYYLSMSRNDASDLAANSNTLMNGYTSSIDQISPSSAGTQYTQTVSGYESAIYNFAGGMINVTGFSSNILVGTSSTSVGNPYVTTYYGLRAIATVGSTSGSFTATIGNYYAVHIDAPTVRANGSITNRWGIYAPDTAMTHYLNGNLLIGTTTNNGTDKLQVNGSARFNISTYQTQIASTGILFNGQRGGQNYSSAIYAHSFDNASNNYIYAGSRPANTALNAIVHYVATDNQVYWDTTNASYYWLTSSTQKMILTTSGNLGVGVNSPSYKLDVGNSARVAGYLIGVDGSAVIKYVFTNDGGDSYINSGKVGIGTASPTSQLHLAAGNGIRLNTTFDDTFPAVTSAPLANHGEIYGSATSGSDYGTLILSAGGGTTLAKKMSIFLKGYGATDDAQIRMLSGNTAIMTLLNTGNVGIGTTSPAYNLDINPASGSPNVRVMRTGGTDFRIGSSITATGALVGTYTNSPISFLTNSTTAMTLTAGGNLLVATTSDSGAKLQVNGNATLYVPSVNTAALFISANNTNNWQFGINNGADFVITVGGGTNAIGTERVIVTSGGNMGLGTTSPAARLSVSGTFDGFAADSTGVTINTTLGSSTTNNLKNTGLLVTPTLSVANSNVSYAYGVKISPIHSGVYTTSFGYGLYVDALSVSSGTLTNNYSAVFMGGNVGIGTASPQRVLHVHSTTGDNHVAISGTAPSVSLSDAVTGATHQAKFGLATAVNQFATGSVAGDFVMSAQTGGIIFAYNSSALAKITTNGRFLLGTTTESTYLLDVQGTGRFTGKLSIGTPSSASAILEVTSSTQGFLPPRMTGAQVEAISSPAEGLLAYATNAGSGAVTSSGWWGYTGTTWVKLN